MPRKRLEFVRGPLNSANDTSAGAFTDPITGAFVPGGGLILGDYIEITDAEAVQLSNLTIGPPTTTGYELLYGGKYRRIKTSANAVAANVKTGTVACLAAGTNNSGPVVAVQILTAGSGQTQGTYVINASGGSGTGAQAVAVVGSGGTLTQVYLLNGGSGYTSAPTFTVAAGGTPGTILAELLLPIYTVTDYSTAYSTAIPARGVFLNSITPGNFGWIQEKGVMLLLGGGSISLGAYMNMTTAGVLITAAVPTSASVAVALEAATNGFLSRGLGILPYWPE